MQIGRRDETDNPVYRNLPKERKLNAKDASISTAAMQDATRQARRNGRRIGLVPTMGALHEGHMSLIDMARRHADLVVVSLFVNPTQFAAGEDFATYPRNVERDLALLNESGCDIAWRPRTRDIYPYEDQTGIVPGRMAKGMEAAARPHFFAGVAGVVCRLFNHVDPDLAVFGEKDFQQLRVIEHMTADLGFSIRILSAPVVREKDGLAHSSRNIGLTPEQRQAAPALFAALSTAAAAIRSGEATAPALARARTHIMAAGFDEPDYLSACDERTLQPWEGGASGRVFGAARLGEVRLIDNVPV